ncbi:MAG TPA: hypothetical protein VEQ58_00900 [Polyangiaceae bacterium]|nr:hypothetical protein [Polyangiaceae bacterium]
MPARVSTLALCLISASIGVGAGYFIPRAPTPTPSRTVTVAARATIAAPATAPDAPALPLPPPSSLPKKVSPVPAPSVALVPAPRVAVAPPPTTAVPAAPEPRGPSMLSAFRFAGVGPSGGLRLARVRPNTLPAALGLQSGDELLSINKFRLSDPEQALTAYARLRYADRLELAVQRNGQRTDIVYSVR